MLKIYSASTPIYLLFRPALEKRMEKKREKKEMIDRRMEKLAWMHGHNKEERKTINIHEFKKGNGEDGESGEERKKRRKKGMAVSVG